MKDGEIWEGTIDVTPAAEGDQEKLEFRLYRNSEDEVYRTLYLFVDVKGR